MKGFRIVSLTAVIAGLCLAQCGIAQAAGADAAVDPATGAAIAGYADHKDVAIPVKATIATDCGFDPSALPSGTISAGELNGGFDQQIPFSLRCPTAVYVGIVSSNGALKTSAAATTGYTAQRDYLVNLHLVGSGATPAADADCAASTLVTAGVCTFRGNATGTGNGLLLNGSAMNGAGYVTGSFLRVHSLAYGGSPVLVADPSYVDTLSVTLSPKT